MCAVRAEATRCGGEGWPARRNVGLLVRAGLWSGGTRATCGHQVGQGNGHLCSLGLSVRMKRPGLAWPDLTSLLLCEGVGV